MPKYTFEVKAGVVSTVVGGRSIELTSDKSPYTTTDPEEAEQLRAIDGLKEVATSKKEN